MLKNNINNRNIEDIISIVNDLDKREINTILFFLKTYPSETEQVINLLKNNPDIIITIINIRKDNINIEEQSLTEEEKKQVSNELEEENSEV